MADVIIGKLEDFPPGEMREIEAGGRAIAVARIGDALYAMDGVCAHAGGRMGQGTLTGTTVKCPKHGAEYDVATGKNLKKPHIPFAKAADLRTYPVKVVDDEVKVTL